MMIFATLESTEDFFPVSVLFDTRREFMDAVLDPCTVSVTNILRFTVTGDTEEERAENLRDLAIAWSNADWGNVTPAQERAVAAFFRKNGEKYGLLAELEAIGVI